MEQDEEPGIDACLYDQLIFENRAQINHWENEHMLMEQLDIHV